jgi:outer membrane protein, heavy metal efflux system
MMLPPSRKERITMVTDRLRSLPSILGLSLLLVSGCASGMSRDFARLQELTDMPLPSAFDDEVDSEPAPDVAQLLERPLDVDTAVQIAVLNNRDLRATLRELGVERGMLMAARAVPNPTVEVELLPERDSNLELRAEYEISELILAPLRAKVARSELDAARYHAAADLVMLGYRVRAAYRALQASHERLAVAQRRLDALAAARDAAVALADAGSINALESASQIVSYERARLSVAGLELELAEGREALQRLLGLHGEQAGWTIDDPLPPLPEAPPTTTELENRAIAASLELAGSRSELEALADRTGLERTEGWLPEIAVDYHALVGSPSDSPQLGGVRSGAGISLEVPLFNQNRGNTRAAEAAFDGRLERHIGMSVDIRSAAREVGNRLRANHGAARHIADVVLPAQRRVLDETLLQYNAMQLGVFELLAAEQAVLDVELAELAARADYWTTDAAYRALLAGARVDDEHNMSQPASLDSMSMGGDDGGH